jgi:hypothetical protein
MNPLLCWYRGCAAPGDPRPLFAYAHGLPAAVRLCDRHMSELARDSDRAAELVERPAPSDGARRGVDPAM